MPVQSQKPLIPIILEGKKISKGLAAGITFWHKEEQENDDLPKTTSAQHEIQRLHKAIQSLQKEIEQILAHEQLHLPNDVKEIITAYSFLAKDPSWQRQLETFIQQDLSCEQAIKQTLEKFQDKFSAYPFWQQRFHDLKDISQQLKKHLKRFQEKKINTKADLIIVAKNIGVSDLLSYMPYNLKGLVLEESGSATSHAMILACSLGIPIISGILDIFEKIDHDIPVVIDGNTGAVHMHPTQTFLDAVYKRSKNGKVVSGIFQSQATEPLLSLDGIPIHLDINVNFDDDLFVLNEPFVDGVGLFRTELPFMISGGNPTVQMQAEFYKKIFNLCQKHPVIVRTLDVAPDKLWHHTDVSKNIKSNRVTRLWLAQPELLQNQIQAILKAHQECDYPDQTLFIMLPMITDLGEFQQLKNMVFLEIEKMETTLKRPKHVKVGSMIEVPSVLFFLDAFFQEVDFASIGTNDLFQFIHAIDREHAHQHDYDALSPLFVKILKNIIDTAKKHHKEISVCGEIASRPLEAMALLGLGLNKISVSPTAIYAIAAMVRSLPLQQLRNYVINCLQVINTEKTLRHQMLDFAKENNVFMES